MATQSGQHDRGNALPTFTEISSCTSFSSCFGRGPFDHPAEHCSFNHPAEQCSFQHLSDNYPFNHPADNYVFLKIYTCINWSDGSALTECVVPGSVEHGLDALENLAKS